MNPRAPVNPRRLLTWLGLGFGVGGLLLQFVISMPAMLGEGRDVPGALGHFFAYYTILTNIVLVLIYLSEVLPAASVLELFRRPWVRAMMAANIALVALYVFFVLRHLSELEGLFDLADRLLHFLCPVLYVLWWIVAQAHGRVRWSDLPLMLAPTLVYFLFVLARGVWVQEYPYPILNAIDLGYGGVLINALYMTVGLAALMALAILFDRVVARPGVPHA